MRPGRRRLKLPAACAAVAVAIAALAALVLLLRGGGEGGRAGGAEVFEGPHGPAVRLARRRFTACFRRKARLEPLEELPIASKTWGVITRIWEDGTPVKKGDVVLELDSEGIRRSIADHEEECVIKRAELVQTRQKTAKKLKSAGIAATAAELELQWQEIRGRQFLAGPGPLELKSAEQEVRSRRVVSRNRAEEHRILQELAEKGFATKAELERKKLQLIEARLAFERAEAELKRLREGPTELERTTVDLNLEIARHELESARRSLESAEVTSGVQVAHAERDVQRAEQELKSKREDLEKYTLRAPEDGYILHVPPRWGGSWSPGRHVRRGRRIMSVPRAGRLKAVTKVEQAMVDNIEVGTACRVTVAAKPGAAYRGKVLLVSRMGTDEYADLDGFTKDKVGKAGRQVFEVEVELSGDTRDLKPGFRAEVEFVLSELDGALAVPWGAVERSEDGRGHITVLADGRPERREVALGPSDGLDVVLTSGCEEGEVVLLVPPARGPKPREVTER